MASPFGDKPTDEGNGLTTWFAPAGRANPQELSRQINFISNNEIVNGMLNSIGGLLAVLNEERQILAVNEGIFKLLGVDEPGALLGLRPGEALHCLHAEDNSAGCGTGKFCASCGAAIAITTTLATEVPVDRKCALTVNNNGSTVDFCFMVRGVAIKIGGERFVLVFLQDITAEELRSSLERTFFHDIRNSIMGLGSTVELMSNQNRLDSPYLFDKVCRLSKNLIREVNIQNSIAMNAFGDLEIRKAPVKIVQIVQEVRDLFFAHPEAKEKDFVIDAGDQEKVVVTDLPILVRVMANMLLNAFESTPVGGEVKLAIQEEGGEFLFRVWNRAYIPEDTSLRVFQHFFTTKEGSGRGMGTFSMKIFGEKLLGGKVFFSSSEAEGTWFNFSLPKG